MPPQTTIPSVQVPPAQETAPQKPKRLCMMIGLAALAVIVVIAALYLWGQSLVETAAI